MSNNNNNNKNRNNYNRMYDAGKRAETNPVDEVIPEAMKDEVMDTLDNAAVELVTIETDTKEVEPAVVSEPISFKMDQQPSIGKVTCELLNVRVAPFKDANPPIVAIEKDDEVIINFKESTDEWYKVTTVKDNITGYCMKKFIAR